MDGDHVQQDHQNEHPPFGHGGNGGNGLLLDGLGWASLVYDLPIGPGIIPEDPVLQMQGNRVPGDVDIVERIPLRCGRVAPGSLVRTSDRRIPRDRSPPCR